jgi:Leucine-rich repeat (LRR) protein
MDYSIICIKTTSTRTDFPLKELRAQYEKYPSLKADLYIVDKNYRAIPAEAFVNLTFNRLSLVGCKTSVNADAFKGSLGVIDLDLSDNKIENLEFLKYLVNLKIARLQNNMITEIRNQTFVTVSQLQKLYLFANQIRSIEPGSFRSLHALAHLDLSYNKIQVFNEHVSGLAKLKYLYLHFNLIKNLEANVFIGLYQLTDLNLKNNLLETIKSLTFNTDLGNMKILNLENNTIREIESYAFIGLVNLTELNLQHTQLKGLHNGSFDGLSSLKKLEIVNQEIEHLESGTFTHLVNLQVLSLLSNKIKTISSYTFKDLSTLVSLDLRLNEFDTIETDAFIGLKRLQYLFLNETPVSYLKEGSFTGLNELKSLDFYNDFIQFIPNNTFLELNSLVDLNLGYNLITQIDINGLDGLSKVVKIDLSQNRLTTLNAYLFKSTSSLRFLDLSRNLINKIEPGTFSGIARSLNGLNLSTNKLEFLKTFHFINMAFLQSLDLSRNSLSSIELRTFYDLVSLTELFLSGNCLFKIHDNLFVRLSNLLSLSLDENLLHELNPRALRSQTRLTKLNLSNNLIERLDLSSKQFLGLTSVDVSFNTLMKTFQSSSKLRFLDINGNTMLVLTMNEFIYNFEFLNVNRLNKDTIKTIIFNRFPTLLHLSLGFNDLTGHKSFFGYKNDKLKRLILEGATLNSNLSYLSNFKNLEELDLISAISIDWTNVRTYLSTELSFLRMRNLSLTSEFVDKVINFTRFRNLVYLDLSDNRLEYFSSVNENNNPNLKYLILSRNRLKSITSFFSYDFVRLDLSFNFLSRVSFVYPREIVLNDNNLIVFNSSIAFVNSLDLSCNKLTNLATSKQFSYLIYLNLSRNNFSFLDYNFFYENPRTPLLKINVIDLSHNALRSFNLSLSRLVHLKHLDLSCNFLISLREDLFSSLKALERLDLSRNNLVSLEPDLFKTLDDLLFLNLSSNSIKSLDKLQFSTLICLEDLDLSNNSIEFLHSEIFANLSSLTSLYLHMNLLKKIDKLYGLESIRNIFIDSELFRSSNGSIYNLKYSISVRLIKETLNVKILKSVNIIYSDLERQKYDFSDCLVTLFFARFNILLNLKTDSSYHDFMSSCSEFIGKRFFSKKDFMFNRPRQPTQLYVSFSTILGSFNHQHRHLREKATM